MSKKRKVLVVDDERVIADTLAIILNKSGFDASAVYSGSGAVTSARNAPPDLIISDVIMETMNGIEAAIEIASSCQLQDLVVFRASRHADLLKKRAPTAMNLRYSLNPFTRRTCLRGSRNRQSGIITVRVFLRSTSSS